MKLEYDEISPITGNQCVIVEADETTGIESRLCIESGYTTNDRLKTDSLDIEKYESTITEHMRSIKYIDTEAGLSWYPTFMQMPGAMLYCEEVPREEFDNTMTSRLGWKVARVIDIFGEERLKYPIPGQVGKYYTSMLDVDNAEVYDNNHFKNALDSFYSIVKEVYDED
jgi:hypothetical protein